jgi:hypothetical protein
MKLPAWLTVRRRAPSTPPPDPQAELVATLKAELKAAHEREAKAAEQIATLVAELAALADTKAHMVATRTPTPAAPERQPPTPRTPAYANTSVNRGHINIREMRQRARQARPMSRIPPVATD